MLERKDGFTLVELSIVLVIIGLLIGGILVAQSMIQTAKINAAIRQVQQFDIALSNFETKYNQLPGDSNLFPYPGNNDGQLEDFRGCCGQIFGSTVGTNEIDNFWPHLQMSGFNYQNKTFNNIIPNSGFDIDSNNPNAPKVSLDVDAGVVAAAPAICSGNGMSITSNCYSFGAFRNAQAGQGGGGTVQLWDIPPVLKPATMLAIDSKIDDGNPVTGVVQQMGTTGCYSGTAYLTSSSNVTCNMYIKMLSQTGN